MGLPALHYLRLGIGRSARNLTNLTSRHPLSAYLGIVGLIFPELYAATFMPSPCMPQRPEHGMRRRAL